MNNFTFGFTTPPSRYNQTIDTQCSGIKNCKQWLCSNCEIPSEIQVDSNVGTAATSGSADLVVIPNCSASVTAILNSGLYGAADWWCGLDAPGGTLLSCGTCSTNAGIDARYCQFVYEFTDSGVATWDVYEFGVSKGTVSVDRTVTVVFFLDQDAKTRCMVDWVETFTDSGFTDTIRRIANSTVISKDDCLGAGWTLDIGATGCANFTETFQAVRANKSIAVGATTVAYGCDWTTKGSFDVVPA